MQKQRAEKGERERERERERAQGPFSKQKATEDESFKLCSLRNPKLG
jgi:hypothetical protein